MSVDSLLTQDIVLVQPGIITDRYNNAVKDWTTATRTTVPGWLDHTDSSEVHEHRDAGVSGWRLFLPAGTVLAHGDRVEHDNTTFEVDGPPIHRIAPRGGSQSNHTEVRLQVVEG